MVDFEELWGLYDDGWAMTADDNKIMMISFWPKKNMLISVQLENGEAMLQKALICTVINKWLPDMKVDNIKPSIFFNNESSAVIEVEKHS
ncbi:DUF2750 domain-containing protein [Paraclostridium bifermentans]|nr:DUF2750 domain-containing protein [Paraclostridium bifermentans]